MNHLEKLLFIIIAGFAVSADCWFENVLPKPSACGIFKQSSNYLQNPISNDFPWAALIEFETETGIRTIGCNGVLISNQYVLTTAKCMMNYMMTSESLVNVIFGNRNDSSTCESHNSNCSMDILRIGVEDVDINEEFNETKTKNNVALIRLSETLQNISAIQPICISSLQKNTSVSPGKVLYAIGWKHTDLGYRKEILNVTISEKMGGRNIGKSKNENHKYEEICVKSSVGKIICGFEGAGFVHLTKYGWEIEGLMSLVNNCDSTDKPSRHIKIMAYRSWIVNNIKP